MEDIKNDADVLGDKMLAPLGFIAIVLVASGCLYCLVQRLSRSNNRVLSEDARKKLEDAHNFYEDSSFSWSSRSSYSESKQASVEGSSKRPKSFTLNGSAQSR